MMVFIYVFLCVEYCDMTPESQSRRSLLGNNDNKQVPAAMIKQATIEALLIYNDGNGVFCCICPEVIQRVCQASFDNN
jgi:hypothetical protein